MPTYVKPQQFESGQVLGRAALDILRDNDEYFYGLTRRWHCIPCTMSNTPLAGQTSYTAWLGWLYVDNNATLLQYGISATPVVDTIRVYLTLYNSAGSGVNIVDQNCHTGGSTNISGSRDLSTLSNWDGEGLYQLKLRCTKDSNDAPGLGFTFPPHCTYTGSYSFTSPPTISDGNVSSASHFNTWRSNDIYFNACKPRQPAFSGMARAGSSGATLWSGYVYHWGNRLYYSVGMSATGNGKLQIVYDYGGSNEVVRESAAGAESYYDLTGSYTMGQAYPVAVRLLNDGGSGVVYYLYTYPVPGVAEISGYPYTHVGDLAVGQYVYGSTPGRDTRLQLFSDNDNYIFRAMCRNASTGRRDYFVRVPRFERLGGTDKGDLRLIRRYDTLYYRTSGATMEWGADNSYSLTDYDDDNPYQTLDLTAMNDLPYGTIYKISGSIVDFAMEV